MSEFDSLGDPEPGGFPPSEKPKRKVQFPKKRGETSPLPPKKEMHRGPYGDVPDELLSAEMEQEIRDHFGYAKSETRTRAERDRVAARVSPDPAPVREEGAAGIPESSSTVSVPAALPPEIESVWGEGRLDGLGQPASNTARTLIAAWGLEVFRSSALHLQARKDLEAQGQLKEARQDLVGKPRPVDDPNLDLVP